MEDMESYLAWADENLKARERFFANLNTEKLAQEIKELEPKRKVSKRERNPDNEEPRSESRKSDRPRKSLLNYSIGKVHRWELMVPDERVAKSNFYDPDHLKQVVNECLFSVKKVQPKKMPFEDLASNRFKVQAVSAGRVMSGTKILSLAVHENKSKILAAIGNTAGTISLCFAQEKDGQPPLFQEFIAHDNLFNVNDLIFGPTYLLSCGQDGALQKLDLIEIEKGFSTLYDSAGVALTCLTVDSFDDIWVGQADGNLVRFDLRSSSKCGILSVSNGGLSSVCTSKTQISTSSKGGKVAIWDIRMMKDPIVQVFNSNCTGSMAFSPQNPTVMFWPCANNCVQIKQVNETVQKFDHLASINCDYIHRNVFYPAWHPMNGKLFALAGLDHELTIFEGEDDTFTTFKRFDIADPRFLAKHVRLAFHPTLPVLVTANHSSRVSFIRFNKKK